MSTENVCSVCNGYHSVRNCKVRATMVKVAHEMCLGQWKEIASAETKWQLIEANGRWLKGGNLDCVVQHLEAKGVRVRGPAAEKRAFVQDVYRNLVSQATDPWFAPVAKLLAAPPKARAAIANKPPVRIPTGACCECFHSTSALVVTDCGHSFCGPCMSRLLCASAGTVKCAACTATVVNMSSTDKQVCIQIMDALNN